MSQKFFRIDPALSEMLSEAGVAWHTCNKKLHIALVIEGRVVAVMPRTHGENRGMSKTALNIRATVRRHLIEIGRLKR